MTIYHEADERKDHRIDLGNGVYVLISDDIKKLENTNEFKKAIEILKKRSNEMISSGEISIKDKDDN